jgi:23S rRNA maturation-related 3'-5' exoribonuclease YhaM
VKNNLNQSKTNNESNFFTNNNDINIYLTKYIFNKKRQGIEKIIFSLIKNLLIYLVKNMI